MVEDAPPSLETFDLHSASSRSAPFANRSRRVGVIAVVILVLFGLFILAVSWSAIAGGTLSAYQKFDLSVVLVIEVVGLALLLRAIPRHVPGALSLRLNDTGLELVYPNGKIATEVWNNPRLEIELMDLSDANPSSIPTSDYPYRISVDGVTSLLTSEAYHAIINQVARHGLVDSVERGGRWFYPADANPLIHHVRAPSSTMPVS